MVLENTGVKAYGGQALNISNPAYISALAALAGATIGGLTDSAPPGTLTVVDVKQTVLGAE